MGTGDLGHRAEDVPVAGTAAQHARQLCGQFVPGHVGSVAEQVVGTQQEAGRAKAALQRVVPAERLLQRVQLPRPAQAFHGQHVGPVELAGEQQARPGRLAVNQHRAHSADAVLAAEVRAGEPEPVAQGVGEREPGRGLDGHLLAVDGHGRGRLRSGGAFAGGGGGRGLFDARRRPNARRRTHRVRLRAQVGVGQFAGSQRGEQAAAVAGGGMHVAGGVY
jgi:hypothetical protein